MRPHDFELLQGKETLAEYRFGEKAIAHMFCTVCGVQPFAHADFEPMGGPFHAVNIACLDDATPEELDAAPIVYENGIDDDWYNPPAHARYL